MDPSVQSIQKNLPSLHCPCPRPLPGTQRFLDFVQPKSQPAVDIILISICDQGNAWNHLKLATIYASIEKIWMAHVLHGRSWLLKCGRLFGYLTCLESSVRLEYRTWRRCGPGARLTPKSLGFTTWVEVVIRETEPTEASQTECKLVHDVS